MLKRRNPTYNPKTGKAKYNSTIYTELDYSLTEYQNFMNGNIETKKIEITDTVDEVDGIICRITKKFNNKTYYIKNKDDVQFLLDSKWKLLDLDDKYATFFKPKSFL